MKDKIIGVALRQFEKFGIRSITIQKLVAPLEISTKTVYKYFPNKEELLRECLQLHYARLVKEWQKLQASGLSPACILLKTWYEAIRLDFGVNHKFYHDLNYYYPELQDAVLNRQNKEYAAQYDKLLKSGMEQGYFRDSMNRKAVLISLRILYHSITRTEAFKKSGLSPAEIIQNTVEPYVKGLCTEKGLLDIQENYFKITQ